MLDTEALRKQNFTLLKEIQRHSGNVMRFALISPVALGICQSSAGVLGATMLFAICRAKVGAFFPEYLTEGTAK